MNPKRERIEIRASGKLMISGEYAVLDGARTWAIPTKYGQTLTANPSPGAGMRWTSLDHNGKKWFEALWDGEGRLIDFTDSDAAELLHDLLHFSTTKGAAPFSGWNVHTSIDFPREWGLGTSSSMVALLGRWLQMDPFTLFDHAMTGSGYDVAVASSNRGCVYRIDKGNREIVHVDHIPAFADHLYFVYSGSKQSSQKEVLKYSRIDLNRRLSIVSDVNTLTQSLLTAKTIEEFSSAMRKHESMLGTILERETMNEKWSSIAGAMKHLGAWGGDFFLLATTDKADLQRLQDEGVREIFPWKEMMLDY